MATFNPIGQPGYGTPGGTASTTSTAFNPMTGQNTTYASSSEAQTASQNNMYGYNVSQGLNPNGSVIASPIKNTPPSADPVSTPVITAKAAQDDYNEKYANYTRIQNDIANQNNSILRNRALQQKSQAEADLQQSQMSLQQQGIDIKKADSDAKNYVLSLAGKAAGTEIGAPNAGTAYAQPSTSAVSSGLGTTVSPSPVPPSGTPTATQPGQTPDMISLDTINRGLKSTTDSYLAGKSEINNQATDYTNQAISALNSARNGTLPLNASQNALISSLQNQLQQNVQSQQLANQSYTGAVKQAGFRAGGEYTPEQYAGQIAQSVSYGVNQIQKLDNESASTIAQLQNSFQSQNYQMINQQYDMLMNQLDKKSNAIQDTYKTVTDQLQAQKDFYQQQVNKQIQIKRDTAIGDLIKQGIKNPAEILSTLNNKGGNYTAEEVKKTADNLTASEKLEAGVVGEYQYYSEQERKAGRPPMSFMDYKNYKAPGSGGDTDAEDKLRKEYMDRPEIKTYQRSKGAYDRMNALVPDRTDATYDKISGDEAALKGLLRQEAILTDPSATRVTPDGSVVDSDSLAGTVEQQYEKLTKDKAALPGKIKQLVNSADKYYQVSAKSIEPVNKEITDLATKRGVKLDLPMLIDPVAKIREEENNSQALIDDYVMKNPADKEMIASMMETPSPAFGNKPPTHAQVVEYLRTKGKIK